MDQRTKRANFYKKRAVVESRWLKKRLAISSGDPEGVGLFITRSSLKKIGPKKNFQFVIWSDKNSPTLKIPRFKTLVFKNEALAFKSEFREDQLLQIKAPGGPGDWLTEAGKKALSGEVSALITGPVSKSSLKKYQVVGQTDLLKKLCGAEHVFMGFRGSFFNVILLTDHCSLKSLAINQSALKAVFKLGLSARSFLPTGKQKKPLGLLGLNPHAGEGGLLGWEEEKVLKPLLKNTKEVEGPLSPDVAFLKKNWQKYSFFIALYHDQGLIPFKMIHNQKAFVQTLGLPFIRLGVNHGTGLGLKPKQICCDSFLLALKEALKIS